MTQEDVNAMITGNPFTDEEMQTLIMALTVGSPEGVSRETIERFIIGAAAIRQKSGILDAVIAKKLAVRANGDNWDFIPMDEATAAAEARLRAEGKWND